MQQQRQSRSAYFKHVLAQFWHSFIFDKRFAWMILFEILFLLLIGALLQGATFGGQGLKNMVANINLDKQTLPEQTNEQLQGTLGQIQTFVAAGVVFIVAFVLLAIILYSCCAGLVWLTVLNKTLTLRYFVKFTLMTVLWSIIWLLPWTVLLVLIGPGPVQVLVSINPWIGQVFLAAFLALVLIHPILVMQWYFTSRAETARVKPALAAVFTQGYGHLPRFIIPYILGFLVFIILSLVEGFIITSLSVSKTAGLAIVALCTILFVNWFKLYFSDVLHHDSQQRINETDSR